MSNFKNTPINYDPEYMDEEKLPLVTMLREQLKGYQEVKNYTDLQLYKFLKARDFKLDVAAKLFLDMLDFRKSESIDNLVENYEPPYVLKKYSTAAYHGVSKSGHLVWYDRITLLDLKGLLKSVRPSDFRKYYLRETEIMRLIMARRVEKTGKPCHQNIIVYDFYGLSWSLINKEAVQRFASSISDVESNYPESMYQTFIIRAPTFFPMVYNLVKGLLPQETQKKITVCGKNYYNTLREFIEEDQIPDFLGGSCKLCAKNNGKGCGIRRVDADIFGLYEGIRAGGPIPEKYYLNSRLNDWNQYEIKSGKEEYITVPDVKQETIIEYEYSSKDFLLEFSILFNASHEVITKENFNSMEVVVSKQKNETVHVPHKGSYTCAKEGTYVLLFANSQHYSAAKLYLHYQLVSANGREDPSATASFVYESDEPSLADTTPTSSLLGLQPDNVSALSMSVNEAVIKEGPLYALVEPSSFSTTFAKSKDKRKEAHTEGQWVLRYHMLTTLGRLLTYLPEDHEKCTGCHHLDGLSVRKIKKNSVRCPPVSEEQGESHYFFIELKDTITGSNLLLCCAGKEVGKEWLNVMKSIGRRPKHKFFSSFKLKRSQSQESIKRLDIHSSYVAQPPHADTHSKVSGPHEEAPKWETEEPAPPLGVSPPPSVVTRLCAPLNTWARRLHLEDGKELVILALLGAIMTYLIGSVLT
ncbi:uncharacterized protein LOC135120870 isoform X2 [Zophobas morio]|uniref:uncharacterized protein LOC135120870 isoform X2 n=1 Tax=Zophobas morio TaxID=2755281 RepID=UPI0030832B1E